MKLNVYRSVLCKLFCIFLLLVSSNCVYGAEGAIGQFENGKTLAAEVEKVFGDPVAKLYAKDIDGKRWIYRAVDKTQEEVNYILFDFTKDGVMVNYGHVSKKDVRDVLLEVIE